MATGPKIPTDPVELLTPDLTRIEPLINKYWGPALCGSMAFVGVLFGNWATKRPLVSGLQKYVLFTGLGVYIGKVVEDYRSDYLAERDAVLRHYIQLHPEDFPVIERKKYADILDPWVPIR